MALRRDGKSIIDKMVAKLKGRDNVEIFTSTAIGGFEGFSATTK